ncbi:Mpo1-like protein [Paraburkholderia ferrariae]|uniref:Mpo1-like protein n=1 Tax=Paraburkholderia ferrariae TaxID=386056 RepID=UPI0038993F67
MRSATSLAALAAAFAGFGHFFFEHNERTTVCYPFLSFAGDWRTWRHMLVAQIKFCRRRASPATLCNAPRAFHRSADSAAPARQCCADCRA